MTKSATERAADLAHWALTVLPFLSILGLAGVVVTVAMGFEEPNPVLLILSSVALLLPVLAAFVHLAFTAELTRTEKRIWLLELVGRQAPLAWSSYLTCSDRREAAKRLAEQRERRWRRYKVKG